MVSTIPSPSHALPWPYTPNWHPPLPFVPHLNQITRNPSWSCPSLPPIPDCPLHILLSPSFLTTKIKSPRCCESILQLHPSPRPSERRFGEDCLPPPKNHKEHRHGCRAPCPGDVAPHPPSFPSSTSPPMFLPITYALQTPPGVYPLIHGAKSRRAPTLGCRWSSTGAATAHRHASLKLHQTPKVRPLLLPLYVLVIHIMNHVP
jgi:hypothetical protein